MEDRSERDGNDNLDETETDASENQDNGTKFLQITGATNSSEIEIITNRGVSNNFEYDDTKELIIDTDKEKNENEIVIAENEAPDGGWGWFIVVGALLLRTVIGGLGRSHGLFYLKFKERFQGTATSVALVTSLTGILRLSGGPVVSILSGRFQCRVLTLVGTMILFLGLILTGFAPSLQFLYFSYGVVAGIGRAFTLTPVPILLGYYFNKRRSLAFGLASAGFSIGGFAITPIVELLFQHYGYRGTFLILSGFALNIVVASALFRPIELHRRLISLKRKTVTVTDNKDGNSLKFNSLEQIESGTVLGTSTVSIDRLHVKSSNKQASTSSSSTLKLSKTKTYSNVDIRIKQKQCSVEGLITNPEKKQTASTLMDKTRSNTNVRSVTKPVDCSEMKDNNITEKAQGENEQKEALLRANENEVPHCKDRRIKCEWFCCRRKPKHQQENTQKKAKLISWSVLKDTRFQCYVFATFCFTLPASTLFLPALAKSKGLSEIQAATLLSVSAGFDTVFRVLSGIILDIKMFRSIRPQIYNGVTFLQGTVVALYPLMTSFSEFMTLSAVDGAVQGTKMAQGTVIMLDILGVDKLSSSLAITMTVQCIAMFLGPTISGQLSDSSGSYDAAFYFGSGAILLGGLVMAGGNIAKHCRDKRNLDNKKDFKDS